MKHRIQIEVVETKRGFFGITRKVRKKKTVLVDDKTYRKLKQQSKYRPLTIDEMYFYDCLFGG